MRQLLIAALLFIPIPVLSRPTHEYEVEIWLDQFGPAHLMVEVVSNRIIKPRFEVRHNWFWNLKKSNWRIYQAKGVRACPLEAGLWGNQSCITSEGESIEVPAGVNPNKFRYDFKYETKNGQVWEQSFELKKLEEVESLKEQALTYYSKENKEKACIIIQQANKIESSTNAKTRKLVRQYCG